MSAPYSIHRPTAGGPEGPVPAGDLFNSYLDRLMKLLPGEVIAFYLVGIGLIPTGQNIWVTIWALVCLIAVIVVKALGTADAVAQKPPDWVHVGISTISYLIWIYTLGGGPFAVLGVYVPFVGSLLVLIWTFFVPYIYKGPAN